MRSDKHRKDNNESMKWAVLGFFLPVVGMVLLIAWRNKKPIKARNIGIGTITGFSLWVVIGIIFFIIYPSTHPTKTVSSETVYSSGYASSTTEASSSTSEPESETTSTTAETSESSTSTSSSSTEETTESSNQVNTRNLTTQQVQDWVDNVLHKRAESSQWNFLKDNSYETAISMGNDRMVYIDVWQTAAGYATQFRINAEGQLEESSDGQSDFKVIANHFGETGTD